MTTVKRRPAKHRSKPSKQESSRVSLLGLQLSPRTANRLKAEAPRQGKSLKWLVEDIVENALLKNGR